MRQPIVMVVTGQKSVGKTYQNIIEIENYVQDTPLRKGRKVLIFDTNEEYTDYKTLDPRYISRFTSREIRRILPRYPNGTTMSLEDQKEMVATMLQKFKNGMLVLEDIDKYMMGARGQSIVGTLVTNRHSGLDILISHQSLSKMTTTEWENSGFLRMHKQMDDIDRYENRIPDYPLIKIASIIVADQYYSGNERYYIYVDRMKGKLRGCSESSFENGVKKYLNMNEREVKNEIKQGYFREDAMRNIVSRYKTYIK